MAARHGRHQTVDEKRLSVATNAVAWAIFGDDGREHIIPGMANMTEAEVAIAMRIATHVLAQIDEYDGRSE